MVVVVVFSLSFCSRRRRQKLSFVCALLVPTKCACTVFVAFFFLFYCDDDTTRKQEKHFFIFRVLVQKKFRKTSKILDFGITHFESILLLIIIIIIVITTTLNSMATSAKQIQITEQTSRAVVENQLRVGLDVVCYQRGIFYIIFKFIGEGEKDFEKKYSARDGLSLSLSLSLSLLLSRVPCRPSSHSSLFERARRLFRFLKFGARARADSLFFSFSLSGFL
jgi:hypothetical protein